MKVRQSLPLVASLVLIATFLLSSGCESENTRQDAYVKEILQWRKVRLQRLTGPTSWASLIGRFPVPTGVSSFGTHDTCSIRFPRSGYDFLGTLNVDTTGLNMYPARGITIHHTGTGGSTFMGGRVDIVNPPMFHVDALYWTFIERSGEYFLRLWDTLSPARQSLQEIPAYPVDPEWNISVAFTPADSGATIILDDIQGLRRPNKLEGSITGAWQDTVFTLFALDGGEKELFIIIEDATTDFGTYPGGRYLYIPRADSTGHTFIDFNKAYNPPCAFTEFATCLLPPPENRLPFAVRAGEKEYHHQ